MDQRMDALRRANEVRALRAQLKRDLKAGRVSMGCSCQDTPEIGNSRAPRSRARMEGSNRGARVSVKAPGSLGGSSRTRLHGESRCAPVTLLRAKQLRRSSWTNTGGSRPVSSAIAAFGRILALCHH